VTLQELIERMKSQPGVLSAAAISDKAGLQITIENRQTGAEEDYPRTSAQGVTPDYFRAMGIRLLAGRAFSESDHYETPRVAVISEALAKRCFPNENPVGERFHASRLNPGQVAPPDRWSSQSPWVEIVGVASDVKSLDLDAKVALDIYVPYWQWPMQSPALLLRAAGDPARLASALRGEINALNKNLPAPKIQTMDDRLRDAAAQPRFQTLLLGLFGLLALALVSTGVYGVVSYSVARRSREIGLRMALGAQTRDVLRLVIGQGMTLALIGIAVGLAGALALTRVMASLLYGLGATDPATFAAVTLLLVVVAFAACWIPARRATKVDPMIALKCE
jgi:putative ABC transport system permease protein